MNVKTIIRCTGICIMILAIFACASQQPEQVAQPTYSADSLTLDAAIAEAASYFTQRLPQGAKVALVPIDAQTGRLSDYVFEELWTRLEDSNSFVMVERRNLERIEAELMYQYQSGRVDDTLIASMSRQYGADILV
jgi:curli biogenesis system outer membrane secretion channel CsgG